MIGDRDNDAEDDSERYERRPVRVKTWPWQLSTKATSPTKEIEIQGSLKKGNRNTSCIVCVC